MHQLNKPGHVRDAVDAVLSEASPNDLSLTEITAKVSARLGSKVAPSSISSSLRLRRDAVERTSRGRYRHRYAQTSIDWIERPLSNSEHDDPEGVFRFQDATLHLQGANEWLREQPENTIQGVVTDPPLWAHRIHS